MPRTKKKRIKPKKPRTQKSLNKQLLKEWSLKIRERDKHLCQICKSSKTIQAHHIIPKSIKETRFSLQNGISLCYSCHEVGRYSAHKNAIFFAEWLRSYKPEQYKFVVEILKELKRQF